MQQQYTIWNKLYKMKKENTKRNWKVEVNKLFSCGKNNTCQTRQVVVVAAAILRNPTDPTLNNLLLKSRSPFRHRQCPHQTWRRYRPIMDVHAFVPILHLYWRCQNRCTTTRTATTMATMARTPRMFKLPQHQRFHNQHPLVLRDHRHHHHHHEDTSPQRQRLIWNGRCGSQGTIEICCCFPKVKHCPAFTVTRWIACMTRGEEEKRRRLAVDQTYVLIHQLYIYTKIMFYL